MGLFEGKMQIAEKYEWEGREEEADGCEVVCEDDFGFRSQHMGAGGGGSGRSVHAGTRYNSNNNNNSNNNAK